MTKAFFPIYIFLIIFLSIIIFITFNFSPTKSDTYHEIDYYFSNSEFIWPLPGIHTITSYFGPRKSPTGGASSNHSGIDIGAPQNTNIYSVLSGVVTFIGFKGAGRIYNYNSFK